ncbi:hypothetical protein E4U41_004967 [Claviceps citrina]|nr:hypothetical protein E4U41_004967 [Claviceps citrina]
MSLAVAPERRRDRPRSRRRSRDENARSSVSKLADAREPSYNYPEDNLDDRYRLPYPWHGGLDEMLPGSQSLYSYGGSQPIYQAGSPSLDTSFRGSRSHMERKSTSQKLPGAYPEEDVWRSGDELDRRTRYSEHGDSRHDSRNRSRGARSRRERVEDDLAYGKLPGPSRSHRTKSPPAYGTTFGSYISNLKITDIPSLRDGRHEDGDWRDSRKSRHEPSHRDEPRTAGGNVLTVEPGVRESDGSWHRRGAGRDRSPQPPTSRMSSLTVGTGLVPGTSLSAAPPSPLLESYKGTYQDCSPMPSPLLLASKSPDSDVRGLEALPASMGSDMEGDGKRRSRRARFHDTEEIASQLAKALKGSKAPDTQPLVDILPSLTHEQVMELRTQYKRIVKTGSDRKGVNIAKHIRARLKDEDVNLMKACYSVALGKWESEAYWASFWYQGNKTRRELLIESLMGRTNEEIKQIKDAFTDKKYDNSLTKCIKTELKEDKFKKAVLMVLGQDRMDDFDPYGRRIPLDHDLVADDVDQLRKAVKAEKGGESAMLGIVVHRGDAHLRAVLQEYEHRYRANFAREALSKSGNLVGEVLAHILNGVINRPVRDALLLNHALTASRRDSLRRELLISRLVRFHWDPVHMQAVKNAYRERYGVDLSDAVSGGTSGEWGRFCRELCIVRMPERVEIIY